MKGYEKVKSREGHRDAKGVAILNNLFLESLTEKEIFETASTNTPVEKCACSLRNSKEGSGAEESERESNMGTES